MKNKCSLCKKLLVKKSGNQKFCLPQCSYQAKKIFRIFEIIKQRCRNGYCGGVKVYKGWVKNKNTFLLWAIKSGWHEGLEIDRKNNQEGYFPKNCRFVTKSENCRNRRSGSTDWISMKRKCNLCHKTKHFSEFPKNKVKAGKIAHRCFLCSRISNNISYKKTKKEVDANT